MKSIIARSPFNRQWSELEKELHDMFPLTSRDVSNVETSDWYPAIDIKEEDKQFVIVADVPGVDPKAIDVSMDNNILTIRGERESEHKEEHEGFVRYERAKGSFYRRFSLPDTADAEKIEANSNHGVLRISIPKKTQNVTRKIDVKS